jgi:hypothetical protein
MAGVWAGNAAVWTLDRLVKKTAYKAEYDKPKPLHKLVLLKGIVSRDFRPLFFFHESNPPGPLIYYLELF